MAIKKFDKFFNEDNGDDEASHGKNYMIKANLTKIEKLSGELSKKIDESPDMDIDEWAKDHISKSADNVAEVYDYMKFNNDSADAEENGIMERNFNTGLTKQRPTKIVPPVQSEIASLIRNALKPGTDRGSTQAIIDTKDIDVAAELIYNKFLKP